MAIIRTIFSEDIIKNRRIVRVQFATRWLISNLRCFRKLLLAWRGHHDDVGLETRKHIKSAVTLGSHYIS